MWAMKLVEPLLKGTARSRTIHTNKTISASSQWVDYVRDGFVDSVGKTPLIKLREPSEETGCDILVKAEFMNPGGSVKDRAALYLVKDAEDRGLLTPGTGTVVEGTAGNTGIGLAHICNSRGYKCVIYMPDTQSAEKISTLRLLGADVRPVPAVPFDDPANYNHQAARYAEQLDNTYWANQFDNTANRMAHYKSTAPEIWQQTDGKIDAFVCATGTGGTLAGVGRYLKEKNENIKIVLADPPGSVLFNYVTNNVVERKGTGSITEGIGQGRVTSNLEGTDIDFAVHIPDEDSVRRAFDLLNHEGFCIGASSGLNVQAAVEVAHKLGPGHTVVSLLCDSGQRYATRLFSRSWMEEKGLVGSVPEDSLYLLQD